MTDIDFEELDRAVQSAIDDFSGENDVVQEVASVSPALPPKPVARPAGRSLDSFSSPKSNVSLTPTVKKPIVQPQAPKGPVIDIINPARKNPVVGAKEIPTPKPEIETEPELEIVNESLEVEEVIKESPFIENAKVDKRPLGAFSNKQKSNSKSNELLSKLSAEMEALISGTTVAEPEVEVVAKPEEVATPTAPPVEAVAVEPAVERAVEAPTYVGGVDEANELPPELHSDILAVEATGMIHQQEPLSNENVGLEEAKKAAKAKTTEPKNEPVQNKPAGAEESLYTSEAYTKPLAHSKKKKSGWLTVVLILLLILVGAAGGAAAYYFKFI